MCTQPEVLDPDIAATNSLCRISCGLMRHIRIDRREVEFPGDQADHGAYGREPAVVAGFALGRLEQAVKGFQEAVGGPRLRPGDMPSR